MITFSLHLRFITINSTCILILVHTRFNYDWFKAIVRVFYSIGNKSDEKRLHAPLFPRKSRWQMCPFCFRIDNKISFPGDEFNKKKNFKRDDTERAPLKSWQRAKNITITEIFVSEDNIIFVVGTRKLHATAGGVAEPYIHFLYRAVLPPCIIKQNIFPNIHIWSFVHPCVCVWELGYTT